MRASFPGETPSSQESPAERIRYAFFLFYRILPQGWDAVLQLCMSTMGSAEKKRTEMRLLCGKSAGKPGSLFRLITVMCLPWLRRSI